MTVTQLKTCHKFHRSLSARKFIVGGQLYSIDEFVSRLDPMFKYEPMSTFLICGGTLGDPPLQDHVITPSNMDNDAEIALSKFANNKANARYDEAANAFFISSYFEHYAYYDIPKFKSAHELVASYMKLPPPVENITLLKTFIKFPNNALNDVEPAPLKTNETKEHAQA